MAEKKYEFYDYETTFSDVKIKLAELKYIDDVLTEFVMKDEDPHDGLNMSTPERIKLGTTKPFEALIWYQENADTTGYQAFQARLEELSTQATSWAYPEMSSLHFDNESLTQPSAADFKDVSDQFLALSQQIENAVPEDLGQFGGTLAHWEGDAALAFDRNFVGPFKDVRNTHWTTASRMSMAYGIAKAIVDCGQQSVMNAIVTAQEWVDDQLQKRQDDHTSSGSLVSKDTVQLVGSAISLIGGAAALTGPGAAPGAVVSVVGGAISFASEALPEDAREKKDIKAATAEELFTQLESMCRTTRSNYVAQWEAFGVQDARPISKDLQSDEAHGWLFPPRTNLEQVAPGAFHHDSSTQF